MTQKRAMKTLKRQPRLKAQREKKLAEKLTYNRTMKELFEQMSRQDGILAGLTPEELEPYLQPEEATPSTEPIIKGASHE